MKRKISLICLFVVCLCCLCSVFAGCGGKDVGGKTDENVPSTEQTDDKNEQNDEHQPATDESFIITFYDENGKEIESRTWQANSVPNCDYEKADTKEWDYTFKGWATTAHGDVLASLPAVTATANYYAIMEKTEKRYSLEFEQPSVTTASEAKTVAADGINSLFLEKTAGLIVEKKERFEFIYDYFQTKIALAEGDLDSVKSELNALYKDFYELIYDAAETYKTAENVKAQTLKQLESLNNIVKSADGIDLLQLSTAFESAKTAITTATAETLQSVIPAVLENFKTEYADTIRTVIAEKITDLKAATIAEIRRLTDVALSKIADDGIRADVVAFRDEELEKISSVSTAYQVNTVLKEIVADFNSFLHEKFTEILNTVKAKAKAELDQAKDALLAKISDADIKSEINTYYETETGVLTNLDSLDDAPAAIEQIKADFAAFAQRMIALQLSKLKAKAKAELDELVAEGLKRLNDENLKTQLNDFYNTETAKIDAIAEIDEVSPVMSEVLNDTQNFVKRLVASQIAELRETVKGYFNQINEAFFASPYDYLPAAMTPGFAANLVNEQDMEYDFSTFVNVSEINYGGFGKQWNMVIDNIGKSEFFYKYLNTGNSFVAAALNLVNEYYDSEYADTIDKRIETDNFTAEISYKNQTLTYTLQYKTGIENGLLGEIVPTVSMIYDAQTQNKNFSVIISDNIGMRYSVGTNKYEFGIEYGISAGSRTSYLVIERKDDTTEGHIYEYITLKGKDMMPACADFYIGEEYVSVVGNKADAMTGTKGYISELYNKNQGKLLGYEVRETISSLDYNTLWFNLNDISGITNIKIGDKTDANQSGKSENDVYLNGNETLFKPTYNTKFSVKTSRKYDIEFRTRYFYGKDETGEIKEYEVKIPMMFIQEDNDKDHNFTDYPADMLKDNGVTSSVTINAADLDKILSDYDQLIDDFINKNDKMSSTEIRAFIRQ